MSSTATKICCVTCGKEVSVLKCKDCWQTNDNDRSVMQSALTPQATRIQQQHALIQQVDDWECNSINQIRQMAEEARQLIIENITGHISTIEMRLSQLAEQLRQSLQEKNFAAQNVSKWQEELVHLSKQLAIPSSSAVRQVSSPLITKILVDLPGERRNSEKS